MLILQVSDRLKSKKKKEDDSFADKADGEAEDKATEDDGEEPAAAKYFKGDSSQRTPAVHKPDAVCHVSRLPEEILMMIFAHLSPRDLLNVSGVTRQWNRIALSSELWQAIYPTQWARGCWSLDYQVLEENILIVFRVQSIFKNGRNLS